MLLFKGAKDSLTVSVLQPNTVIRSALSQGQDIDSKQAILQRNHHHQRLSFYPICFNRAEPDREAIVVDISDVGAPYDDDGGSFDRLGH